MNDRIKYVAIIGLILLSCAISFFYWFVYRVSNIKAECSQTLIAKEEAHKNDARYNSCVDKYVKEMTPWIETSAMYASGYLSESRNEQLDENERFLESKILEIKKDATEVCTKQYPAEYRKVEVKSDYYQDLTDEEYNSCLRKKGL